MEAYFQREEFGQDQMWGLMAGLWSMAKGIRSALDRCTWLTPDLLGSQ